MPWDASTAGGFTNGWPWLPLGDEHEIVNVTALERDDNSILRLYRNLIQLRQTHPVLVNGKLEGAVAEQNVLRYERTSDLHPTNKDPFAGTPALHPTNKDPFAGAPALHPTNKDPFAGTPALHPTNKDPFAGTPARERLLVLLNMAAEAAQISVKSGTVLISTHLDREGTKVDSQVKLRAGEGLVISLEQSSGGPAVR